MLPSATVKASVFFAVKKGFWLSFALLVVKRYIFDDWQFFGFLCTLIMVQAGGAAFARLLNRFRGRPNPKTSLFMEILIKIYIYFSVLIMTHVLISFTVRGKVNVIFQWFDTFAYSVIVAHEALSIFKVIDSIDPRLLPPILRRPLDKVLKDGPAAIAAGLMAAGQEEIAQREEDEASLEAPTKPNPAVIPASPQDHAEE